jgi:hypothetical protein
MPENPNAPIPSSDDAIKTLEGAESTELEDESLEEVSGGNTQCHNESCCMEPLADG